MVGAGCISSLDEAAERDFIAKAVGRIERTVRARPTAGSRAI